MNQNDNDPTSSKPIMKWIRDHPAKDVIGPLDQGVRTGRAIAKNSNSLN